MSLVGPRPKMPEHVMYDLPCRPGITGLATTVFACEERILASVAKDQLDAFYHSIVLPAKRGLDAEYMARATFSSDFSLLANSVLRRWDTAALDELIVATAFEMNNGKILSRVSNPARTTVHLPIPLMANREVNAHEVSIR
jgi:hypothetical protein